MYPENTYLKDKRKVQMSFTDVIVFPIVFVLTSFLINSVLTLFNYSNKRGTHVALIYFGFFIVATLYIALKRKSFHKEALLPGILALLTAVSYILRGDEYHFLITFFMLIYLSGSYCVKLTGEAKETYGSYFYLLEVWRSEVLVPIKNTFLPMRSMKTLVKTPEGEKKKLSSKALGIIGGALLAIPVLGVVLPLLLESDAAFDSLAVGAVEKIKEFLESLFDNVGSGILIAAFLALFVAPYIYNVMFCFRYGVTDEKREEKNEKYITMRFVPSNVFAGFLGVISFVYVIYLLSQFAYFFSAFTGKLPDGSEISVTEYARRGFFEMAAVAVINLAIIGVTVLFAKRNKGVISRMIKAFDLFLCAFTIILVMTSVSKIFLYIAEMGLTHKRLYVFIIDLILIVTFSMVMVRIFKKDFPYMKVILAFACSLITLMSLAGTDGLIARYNTEMYLKGNLRAVDAYQLEEIGLPALKSLHKLSLNENESDKILNYSVKQAVANIFYEQVVDYKSPEEYKKEGIPDFGFSTVDDYLALRYAEENFEELSEIHQSYGWWYGMNTDVEADRIE